MTTTTQIKMLVKPLLERHNDLAFVKRSLILKPVHHVARFVLLDGCSSPGQFRLRWCLSQLFEPHSFLVLNFGKMLYRPGRSRWHIDDPDMQSDLIVAIEQMALPQLRARPRLEDYIDYCAHPPEGHFKSGINDPPFRRAILLAAMGDLAGALSDCESLEAHPGKWLPFHKEEFDRAVYELLPPLRARDRQAVAALLHAWEAFTVKANKLEHLWEPTPFPLEGLAP